MQIALVILTLWPFTKDMLGNRLRSSTPLAIHSKEPIPDFHSCILSSLTTLPHSKKKGQEGTWMTSQGVLEHPALFVLAYLVVKG